MTVQEKENGRFMPYKSSCSKMGTFMLYDLKNYFLKFYISQMSDMR